MSLTATGTPKVPNEIQGSAVWGKGASAVGLSGGSYLRTDETLPFEGFFPSL